MSDEPKSPWNSLEIAKILVSLVTLFLLVWLGYWINHSFYGGDHNLFAPDEKGIVSVPVYGEGVGVDKKHSNNVSGAGSAETDQIGVSELFLGIAHAKKDGTGTIVIRFQGGINCDGSYKSILSESTGEGVFKCTDGDKGSFNFISGVDYSGKGFGISEKGRRFKFTFGSSALYGPF